MAKKLTLVPEPEFKAPVPIPVPGQGVVNVEFTFKYRTRDELQRFAAKCDPERPEYDKDYQDHQMVMDAAKGWELADAFTEENVKEFCRQYIAGPAAVFDTYVMEMTGARLKNSGRPRY